MPADLGKAHMCAAGGVAVRPPGSRGPLPPGHFPDPEVPPPVCHKSWCQLPRQLCPAPQATPHLASGSSPPESSRCKVTSWAVASGQLLHQFQRRMLYSQSCPLMRASGGPAPWGARFLPPGPWWGSRDFPRHSRQGAVGLVGRQGGLAGPLGVLGPTPHPLGKTVLRAAVCRGCTGSASSGWGGPWGTEQGTEWAGLKPRLQSCAA